MRHCLKVTILLLFSLKMAACTDGGGPPIPSFDEVKASFSSSDLWLYDRQDRLIHEQRVKHDVRRLGWQRLSEVAPIFFDMLLAVEDQRFFHHYGVDLLALASAVKESVTTTKLRGASTLSMQLARRLELDCLSEAKRSVFRKLCQIRSAIALEQQWTKEEILEAYINLVYYRGELQGLAAASRGLFDKLPRDLDSEEALLLVSLLSSPNMPANEATSRACHLTKSLSLGVSCDRLQQLTPRLSEKSRLQPKSQLAPHAFSAMQREARGSNLMKTTLNLPLQAFVLAAVKDQIAALQGRNVHDAAVVVADNETGQILAYVGGSGSFSSARFVDGVLARRQAGSTLKPFLYALAFEKRLITAATLLKDTPLIISVAGGTYEPRNYDRVFHGAVSAREALGSSLNVPAVRLFQLVGAEEFVNLLRELNLYVPFSAEFYGPSLALGTLDVSLFELVQAYRVLARSGVFTPLQLAFDHAAPELPKNILGAASSYIVTNILADREARARSFGLENHLATRFFTAVKTGTSKDMRDNWCIGFSQRYTVGVWVGNFDGAPMWNVTGISGAGPLWLSIMNYLHRADPSHAPAQPQGLITKKRDANQSAHDELFIEGTQPIKLAFRETERSAHIIYPIDGLRLAIDPDIPPQRQRLWPQASPIQPGQKWHLNGKLLRSRSIMITSLVPGKQELELFDARGKKLETVSFFVSNPFANDAF